MLERIAEPPRPDVRGGNRQEQGRPDARIPELATAVGRGIRGISGETYSLWRAANHEGEILYSVVTKRRDKKVALKLLKKAMNRHGRSPIPVTDRVQPRGAALMEIYLRCPSGGTTSFPAYWVCPLQEPRR